MSKEHLLKGHPPTQFPNNDPTKGGRKPSIKNELKKLLEKDGKIKIPANQIKKINDDGSVLMILPTKMRLAQKLMSLALSGNNTTTLNAIKDIIDRIDGRATQPFSNDEENPLISKPTPIVLSDGRTIDDVLKELEK